MLAEIITIGDEIVSGFTTDTNSVWLSRTLSDAGIEIAFHTSVGDSIPGIESVIATALKRADLVITTGGLGPTEDDLTKRALVRVFRRNLVFNDEVLAGIRRRYEARGMEMPEINQNQALLPQGATLLNNSIGSAVGIMFDENDTIFVALPGVPAEMKQIVSSELLPLISADRTGPRTVSAVVRTAGISESALAELISDEIPLPDGVKLAFLPHYYGTDLRLTAAEENTRLAEELIEQPAGWLKRKLGAYVYGEGAATLESVIGELLREREATLALAESCTAGMIAARIANVPGASEYFVEGFVTYSNNAKEKTLGVSKSTLEAHGAVSEATVREMARGACKASGADFALSVSGVAGPGGGTEDKPVGLVWIAVAGREGEDYKTLARKYRFSSDRQVNRERATGAALNLLRLVLDRYEALL